MSASIRTRLVVWLIVVVGCTWAAWSTELLESLARLVGVALLALLPMAIGAALQWWRHSEGLPVWVAALCGVPIGVVFMLLANEGWPIGLSRLTEVAPDLLVGFLAGFMCFESGARWVRWHLVDPSNEPTTAPEAEA